HPALRATFSPLAGRREERRAGRRDGVGNFSPWVNVPTDRVSLAHQGERAMSLKKDHILGSGSAALAGGAAGAAIGGVLGWLAVCSAAGGASGGGAVLRASEARMPKVDLAHFEQIYWKMPYYVEGRDWHDYAPAYRYGLDVWGSHQARSVEEMESQLQGGWEA